MTHESQRSMNHGTTAPLHHRTTAPPHYGTALITGASEGIGHALARLMAADGWNLVVTARREELLGELAADLMSRFEMRVEIISADLSQPQAPELLISQIENRGIALDALVNNAGFGYYGSFKDQDLTRLEAMVEVNIQALMRLTRLVLPGMIARGRGRMMNIASTASFQPVPLSGVYAATKAFVLSFSLALTEELRGSGVSVSCVCPGVTRTGFQRAAGADYLERAKGKVMSPEEVAQIGYRAMMKGRPLVVTGVPNKLMAFGTRLAPKMLVTRLARKIMEGNLRGK